VCTFGGLSFCIDLAKFLTDFDIIFFGNKPLGDRSGFRSINRDINLDD